MLTRWAAGAALTLGLAHAAVSLYWLAGGTALLDTLGGELERLTRERSTGVLIGLGLVAVVKVVVAFAAPALAGTVIPRSPWHVWAGRRWARTLSWIAAAVLTSYGAVLTVVGQLVVHGAIHASAGADMVALRGHAYLWDPWFLLWGLALTVVLWQTRPNPRADDGQSAARSSSDVR